MTRHAWFILIGILLVIILSLIVGVLIARADCLG
jgi:hypothetical protein